MNDLPRATAPDLSGFGSMNCPQSHTCSVIELSLSKDATIPSHTRLAQRRSGSSMKVALTSEASEAMMGADDIPTRLAALLGRETVQIRKTDETPPRISVIDVAVAVTGKNAKKAAQDVGFVQERHPDVTQILGHVKFPDSKGRKGQRDTPVADVQGIVPTLDSAA